MCVIVAGLPRSGTSLVGGILEKLGVWMGDNPMPDWPGNPKGTFNCTDLELWCDSAFDDFPEAAEREQLAPSLRQSLRALLLAKQSRGVPFGMKCTRLWCAMSAVRTVVTVPIKVICTTRNPARSLASWVDAFNADLASSTELYRRAVIALQRFRTNNALSMLDVAFDDLFDNRDATVDAIADFIGMPHSQAARQFVEPSLRRF